MTSYTLSDLIIYPVKSLAGIHLTHWQVTKKGLLYDRQWMLIDEQGQFLSQRRLPKMALIKNLYLYNSSNIILSDLNKICNKKI